MFIGSGMFVAQSKKLMFEICVNCGSIAWSHDLNYGQCTKGTWQLTFDHFGKSKLEVKDFEHFIFKHYQYLSREKARVLCL